MINRPASRLHVAVLHMLLHIALHIGAAEQDEDGAFTSSAEAGSSIFAGVGRRP
ncbi:hypothetical protein U879_08715 [Defluviimonas sp. 20V17]|nr:hypothetical protein U879_08715 [Defluviimonas sp. 20V17]